MMKKIWIILLLLFPNVIYSQRPDYPETHKVNIVDTFFRIPVTDEYRWLEKMNNPECNEWLEKQAGLTKKELRKATSKCNSMAAIDKYAYVEYNNPIKKGNYYFKYSFYNNLNAPALFVQNSLTAYPTVLVDPDIISTKDNIWLEDYAVSLNSKYLAYQFSRNGSDWAEMKVINIKSGIHKKDHLKNVKFSDIAWKDDGFYYSRYPDNGVGKTQGQEIYFHQLDTRQEEDKLIFRRTNNPDATFYAHTTSDERFLLIKEIDEDKDVANIYFIDFQSQMPALRPLITKLSSKDNLEILDNDGEEFIGISSKGANNKMIVRISQADPRKWKVLIPEFDSALLVKVKLLEDKIVTVYQIDRKQQIVIFDYQGKLLHAIQLPFGFSAHGFNGGKADEQILFSYEGYTQPKIVYILDTKSFKMKPTHETTINYDPAQFEMKELEYESFDGVQIPLYMVYMMGINLKANNPTLLKAYGGFGVIESPQFDPGIVHFLKEGGIYAFANIRGGGDKGEEWAKQGRAKNKPNSFKDFIAAAEFVINEGYTSPDKLAITGASHGGLVVGVAMTQRPELFKVAVPVVAPFDMFRKEEFTVGHSNADEYGSVKDSAGFFNLLSYCPLSNIKDDVNYPATLIMTSEFDDRVPPFHSYKFAAKLQNRKAQENPILLRVERGAGHSGAAGSFIDVLKEEAEMYDFILYHLRKQ